MSNTVSHRRSPTRTGHSTRLRPPARNVLDGVGAFLVSGLYLAALPIELILGTRVQFPFILYTVMVFCFVVLVRRHRLQEACLALLGRSSGRRTAFFGLAGALVFWFALQAFVSPCPAYAQRKYALWLINAVLPLVVGYLWIDKVEKIRILLRVGTIWIALVLAFWVANPDGIANLDVRHVVLRGDFSQITSCSFCRSVSLAAMVCVVSVGLQVFRGPATLLPAGLAPVMLYLALQSGSRGAVLSFAVAASFFLVLSLNRRRLLLLAAVLPVLVAMVFSHVAATNSVTGIIDSGLLQGDLRDGSVIEHFDAWRLSAVTALLHPLGIGFGGYPRVAGYGDEPLYPHNAVLEVWVESGLIGLGLFACLIALPFLSLGPGQFADRHIVAMESLFLITFLFAMTYLGIEGSNPYWFFLGALWSIRDNRRSGPVPADLRQHRNAIGLSRTRQRGRRTGTSRSCAPARTPRPVQYPSDRLVEPHRYA